MALICFVAIWPISVLRRDASLVDLAWGPGFLIQLCAVALMMPEIGERGILLLSIVGLWSARLGWVLARRRIREGHEDPRYTSLRNSWGPSFWWKSLFVVFVLQAFLQWLVVLAPIYGMLTTEQLVGKLAVAGCCTALCGLLLEAVADQQLDRFKSRNVHAHALMTTGLRAYVRHPNYSGEVVFWIGICMILLDSGSLIGLLSPVLILIFLTKISGVPLLDERLGETRPGYAEYRSRVPGFIPRLRSLSVQ